MSEHENLDRFPHVSHEMMRPVNFKQHDVARACKGVRAAGLPIVKVIVRKDEITILTVAAEDRLLERNPWHYEPEKI